MKKILIDSIRWRMGGLKYVLKKYFFKMDKSTILGWLGGLGLKKKLNHNNLKNM